MYVREISDGLYTAFTYLLYKARTLGRAGTPIQRPCLLLQCAQWCHSAFVVFLEGGRCTNSHTKTPPGGHCHPWVTVAVFVLETHADLYVYLLQQCNLTRTAPRRWLRSW